MCNIGDMKGLSKPGVYSLVFNEYAYFGYSVDILVTVSKVLSELRRGVFKIRDMRDKPLNLHIHEDLEGGDNIETLKLRCQYVAREWEKSGGKLWNPATKSLLVYKVTSRINIKRKSVDVLLKRASSRKETIVGSFSNMKEASEFISEFYSSDKNSMMVPVYACNSLTKELVTGSNRGRR